MIVQEPVTQNHTLKTTGGWQYCGVKFVNFSQQTEFLLSMFIEGIENPVRLTPEARAQVEDTFRANKIPDTYGLRVGIRGGGCGSSWLLGFDQPGQADEVFEIDSIRVIIDKKHLLYVLGVEVGYENSEEERGFTIQKPEQAVSDQR
jgi:iron-sulfur cluster assembly protein